MNNTTKFRTGITFETIEKAEFSANKWKNNADILASSYKIVEIENGFDIEFTREGGCIPIWCTYGNTNFAICGKATPCLEKLKGEFSTNEQAAHIIHQLETNYGGDSVILVGDLEGRFYPSEMRMVLALKELKPSLRIFVLMRKGEIEEL